VGAKVHVAARRPDGIATLPWAQRHEVAAQVVVNATPLAAPLDRLPEGAAVLDLQYGPEPSALQRMAESGGHAYTGGRRLLLEQAVLASRHWTGRDPDRAAMERALA
jgi:shikimate 5-dehydrogenase